MTRRNVISITVVIAALILFVVGFLTYHQAFEPNVNPEKKAYELFIRKSMRLNDVVDSLVIKQIIIHSNHFARISAFMGYNDQTIKEGRYLIKPGMSNYKIISKLRSGAQDPVKVTINNVRDIYELSGQISSYLILDSLFLVEKLTDSLYLQNIGYSKENILTLFIPNTYEIYWNLSFEKFMQRMEIEHKKFWNANGRLEKSKNLNLDTKQVYTLASIVEKETNYEPERPIIAGVYLNRLKINMKLQADPTVVFALGVKGLQRVLLEHLNYPSPYNTYLVEGLPPGPIYMPTLNSIDAVLNADQHDYIFFCAKEGYEGRHEFASTLKQHSINAHQYQKWLNKERIR